MKTLNRLFLLNEMKHTLIGSKLDFKNDEDIVELILTRIGSHDIADVIAKMSVLRTFIDMSKEKDKVDMHNASADDEDKETHDFSIDEFASRASSEAFDTAVAVKTVVSNMRDTDFVGLINHFFPDLSQVSESKASETSAQLDSNGKPVKMAPINMGSKPSKEATVGDTYTRNGKLYKVAKLTGANVYLDAIDKDGTLDPYHSGARCDIVGKTRFAKEYTKK